MAKDALFFMVVSLVTDSLPDDLSFRFDDEFSLVFYLSGDEYLVEDDCGSYFVSLVTKGETREAF